MDAGTCISARVRWRFELPMHSAGRSSAWARQEHRTQPDEIVGVVLSQAANAVLLGVHNGSLMGPEWLAIGRRDGSKELVDREPVLLNERLVPHLVRPVLPCTGRQVRLEARAEEPPAAPHVGEVEGTL